MLKNVAVALLFTMLTFLPTAFAATSSAGNNADGATELCIIGLGGIYGIDTTASFSFNAIIPDGFSAARLYFNGDMTKSNKFKLENGTTNNYYISVSFGDNNTRIIGKNIIRLEADYVGADGKTVTKSAEKEMWMYAHLNSVTNVVDADFDALPSSFNDGTDDQKAENISSKKYVSLNSKQGSVDITNEALAGSLKGAAGNKQLRFSYKNAAETAELGITPKNVGNTQILNFSFFAAGDFKMSTEIVGKVTASGSAENKADIELSDLSANEWHDVGIVVEVASKKVTTLIDGKKAVMPLDVACVNGICMQISPRGENSFVAIDDVSLVNYGGKLPDADCRAYYSDKIENRTVTENGIVPENKATAFVISVTKNGTTNYGYILNSDGTKLSDVTLSYRKISSDSLAGGNDSYNYYFTRDGGFEHGKYTAVLNSCTIGSAPTQGLICCDFYVVGENKPVTVPEKCVYDGSEFEYNIVCAGLPNTLMKVIAAVYDGNTLKGVKLTDADTDFLRVSDSLTAEGNTAKIFVWNSLSEMKPHCCAYSKGLE